MTPSFVFEVVNYWVCVGYTLIYSVVSRFLSKLIACQ